MAKIFTYIFIIVGLMTLFNLAGINTLTGYLISQLGFTTGNYESFQAGGYFIALAIVALGALATVGTGIKIGVFSLQPKETSIAAVAATTLLLFLADLFAIIQYSFSHGGWTGYIVFLIMTPIVFGFVLALFDWARGKD